MLWRLRTAASVVTFSAPALLGCVDSSLPASEDDPTVRAPARLVIDTTSDLRPIDPLIFGVNPHTGYECDEGDDGEGSGLFTSCRLGGNRWTAYNWETNLSNAGRDYRFQTDQHLGSPDDPPGDAATRILESTTPVNAVAWLTVPIVDLVAGEETGSLIERFPCDDDPGALCLPESEREALFVENRARKGAPFSDTPDLGDGVVYQDEFVELVRQRAGDERVIFSLDNEPGLWSQTHPEVHPRPATPDEIIERNIEYAAAIKETWPEAEVAGFASWGWVGFTSADNQYQGDEWYLAEYLDRMREAEEEHGQRLIDYVDLHWYPDAHAREPSDSGDGREYRVTTRETFPAMVSLRTQIARGLWDPSYSDPSWFSPGRLQLLVTLQSLIDEHYPGTKVAIGEWHYGAGHHISGGIAHTEVLGAFARERVGLATLWPHHGDEPYVRAAYRVFRDYDGTGQSFGDQTVFAETSRPDTSSVFAGIQEDAPESLVVVAINRLPDAQEVEIEITSDSDFTSARVFTMTAAGSALMPADDVSVEADNQLSYEMPGYSVSVLEFHE